MFLSFPSFSSRKDPRYVKCSTCWTSISFIWIGVLVRLFMPSTLHLPLLGFNLLSHHKVLNHLSYCAYVIVYWKAAQSSSARSSRSLRTHWIPRIPHSVTRHITRSMTINLKGGDLISYINALHGKSHWYLSRATSSFSTTCLLFTKLIIHIMCYRWQCNSPSIVTIHGITLLLGI